MKNSITTGQKIKELRSKKGMTQQELAAKTNISVRTIQRIENGKVDPRAYSLHTIASALDVDFQELLNQDESQDAQGQSDHSSLWLPLLHLSGLFVLLLPPVIIWLWKRNQVRNLREQGIDVINFQLSMLVFLVPLGLLAVFFITIPFLIILGIYSTCVILLNSIKVINGQPYRYPMVIKVLKP